MTCAHHLYFAVGHHLCGLVDHLVSAEMTAFQAEEDRAHMHVLRDREPHKHYTAKTFSHSLQNTFVYFSHHNCIL